MLLVIHLRVLIDELERMAKDLGIRRPYMRFCERVEVGKVDGEV